MYILVCVKKITYQIKISHLIIQILCILYDGIFFNLTEVPIPTNVLTVLVLLLRTEVSLNICDSGPYFGNDWCTRKQLYGRVACSIFSVIMIEYSLFCFIQAFFQHYFTFPTSLTMNYRSMHSRWHSLFNLPKCILLAIVNMLYICIT